MKKSFEELIRSVLFTSDYQVGDSSKQLVERSFQFLEEFAQDKVIYGINTGFGPMAQFKIEDAQLKELQYNLVRSHAAGSGEALSEAQTRAMMICRLNTLTLGKSGVSIGVINTLEAFLREEIYPVIYSRGGVGASGDLVQLAHLALGLIGEGEVSYQGKVCNAQEVLASLKSNL